MVDEAIAMDVNTAVHELVSRKSPYGMYPTSLISVKLQVTNNKISRRERLVLQAE